MTVSRLRIRILSLCLLSTVGCDRAKTDNPNELPVEGSLSVIVTDDFEHQISEKRYFVQPSQGDAIQLQFKGTPPADLKPGARIQFFGSRQNRAFVTLPPMDPPLPPPSMVQIERTLVLLTKYVGVTTPSYSASQVSDVVFNGAASVNAFYSEDSYGKINLVGSVKNWIDIPAHHDCDTYLDRTNAISAAHAAYPDIDFTKIDRLILVDTFRCPGFAGVSSIGKDAVPTPNGPAFFSTSFVHSNYGLDARIIAHELGHGFGLEHANSFMCDQTSFSGTCQVHPYADVYSVMGASYLAQNNLLHKQQLGWVSPDQVKSITESGTFVLEPIETPANGLKGLELPFGMGERHLTVQFRQPIGVDRNITTPSDVFEGASIHLDNQDQTTWLIDATTPPASSFSSVLPVGGRLLVPYSGWSIEVLSMVPNQSLTVRVSTVPGITMQVTTPEEGSELSGITPFAIEASAPTGIPWVEFYVDNFWLGSSWSAPYQVNVNTLHLSNGPHNFHAIAYGNNIPQKRVDVVANVLNPDSEPPQVSLVNPLDHSSQLSLYTIEAAASDNVGIFHVDLMGTWRSIANWETVQTLDFIPRYDSPYEWFGGNWEDDGSFDPGEYSVWARAFDFAGNSTDSVPITFTVGQMPSH